MIDGRPELTGECQAASPEVRRYLATECRRFLRDDRFADALPGYLAPDPISQARALVVRERMASLSTLGKS